MKDNGRQLILFSLVVGGLVFLSSCIGMSDSDSVIRVGMDWGEAQRFFREKGMENQMLDVIPPESPYGGFMGLNNYAIGIDTVLSVVHDRQGGKEIILDMSLITHVDQGLGGRQIVPIREINLREYK